MFFSLIKRKLVLLLLLCCMVCTGSNVIAQTRTWDGSVSDVWGIPLNWTPDEVPDTASENVEVLNVGSGRYPVINGPRYDVRAVELNASNGSITIDAGTLAIHNNLLITDGEFINNANVYASRNATISGSGVFTNSGIVYFDGSNRNVTIDGSGVFTNSGTVYFDGSTDLSSNNQNFGDITVTNGNTLTLSSPLTCNDLTLSGTLDTDGNNLTVNGSITINGSGVLDTSSGGNIYVQGDWDNSGSFDPGMNTVEFTGTGNIVNAETFYDMTVSGGSRSCSNNLAINNDLEITGGTFTADGDLAITWDLLVNGGTLSGSGTIDVDGTVDLDSGTFTGGSRTIRAETGWEETAPVFNALGSTVEVDGIIQGLLSVRPFYNFTVTGTGNVTLGNALDVNGDFIIDGDFSADGYQMDIAGNWSSEGTFNPNSNLVIFSGNGDILNAETFYDMTVSGGTRSSSNNLAINNDLEITGGTFTADGDLTITWDLLVNGGTLSGSGTIDVDGTVDLDSGTFTGGSRTIRAETGWEETAPVFNALGSTVEVDGIIPELLSVRPFYNFTVTGTGNVTLGNALDVNGDFIIDGDFSADGSQMDIAGNWSRSRTGTFIHDSNLVVFDGSSSLNNSEVFYDVTIEAGQSLDISGNVLTVENIFDIEGSNAPYGELIRTGTGSAPVDSDSDSGKVIYRGTGGTIQTYTSQDYWTLEIQGTLNLNGNIEINQDFIIDGGTLNARGIIQIDRDFTMSGGTFNANDSTINITRNFITDDDEAFDCGTSTVVFANELIVSQVLGSNTFYNFECTTPGKYIYFGAGETQNITRHFRIEGIEPPVIDGVSEHNQLVNLYSTYTPHPSTNYSDAPGYPGPLSEQWRIHIFRSATARVDWVYVELSYSEYVIIPEHAEFHDDYNWCHNWLFVVPVHESWTMDNDHNGKIDRIGIVVGPNVNLNDNFGDLEITLLTEGFELKEDPYVTYSDNSHNPAEQNDDTFYIKLKEGPDLNTGKRPEWEITENTLLMAQTGIQKTVATTEEQKPQDQAAPIIAYTLAVADKNEVFVCFSEDVVRVDGTSHSRRDFEYRGVEAAGMRRIQPVDRSRGLREVVVIFNDNINAFDVYNEENLSIDELTRDQPRALSGNGLFSNTHRVSDIGLGLIGNGIIEPVWAKDRTRVDPVLGGAGFITQFNGTEWLRDQKIVLQAHIHDDIDVDLDTQLFMDVNVNPSRVKRGLWLPEFDDTEYNGIVPKQNHKTRYVQGSIINNPVNTNQLQNYTIPHKDPEIEDGALVEFVFKIAGKDLYCARLTDHYFAEDWYRKVRPWSFNIHDILLQEGNVTIMNNVINPVRGEKVKLHYILEQSGKVSIYIFDLKGDIVDILYQGRKRNGEHSISWDGRNRGGRVVTRGVYFIKLVAPHIEEIRKVLVVK